MGKAALSPKQGLAGGRRRVPREAKNRKVLQIPGVGGTYICDQSKEREAGWRWKARLGPRRRADLSFHVILSTLLHRFSK